jgi:hypothetical protein
LFIALANAKLANYLQGGGHWMWFLQYPLGLRAMGHRVLWLEVLPSSGDGDRDRSLVKGFFERLAAYGLERDAAVMVVERAPMRSLQEAEVYGKSREEIAALARDADLLWNYWYALQEPFLAAFKRRAFIDVDPGHLHVCVAEGALTLPGHDVYLTVGSKLGDADCRVPGLGLRWRAFRPFVYLPLWEVAPNVASHAPFTSITQWTWEELRWKDRLFSVSKRTAYLKYVRLPEIAQRPFELAANIGSGDPTGDRDLLRRHGWTVVDPHQVAGSPSQYRQYIRASRAEFMCPKPIHVEMKTGWFSDRSVAYLASGRPVLAEDTGFSERLPTGAGLIAFRDIKEAAAGVAEIDTSYERHSRAARALAEELFDSRRCLESLLSACEV